MGEVPEDVEAPPPRRGDLRALEDGVRGGAGEGLASLEGLDERPAGERERLVVELEGAQASSRAGDGARREELDDPPHVRGGDEVEGAAHRPGPHDAAVGERAFDRSFVARGEAEADRPQGAEVVLGLRGAEVRDDLCRLRDGRKRDLLGVEPSPHHLRRSHRGDYSGGPFV